MSVLSAETQVSYIGVFLPLSERMPYISRYHVEQRLLYYRTFQAMFDNKRHASHLKSNFP
jgi:hypothetical protein